MRETVSVVIPTYNVEDVIEECLESVKWADEIIVVDMFSTDRTLEICKKYPNCKIFQRKDYIYANFNYGANQATSDWIIRLDSDERISEGLKDEILEVLERKETKYSHFIAQYHLYMFGKRLRYGIAHRPYRTIMFRKGLGKYLCQTEHEDLIIQGEYGCFKHHYDHYNYTSISQYVGKINYYTDRDIERVKITYKPKKLKILVSCIKTFYLYFIKYQGYKDGFVGFIDAGLRTCYYFIQEAKYWEKWNRNEEEARLTCKVLK
jgi:glycosyltransferase involved in cell wall biosynthesis